MLGANVNIYFSNKLTSEKNTRATRVDYQQDCNIVFYILQSTVYSYMTSTCMFVRRIILHIVIVPYSI